MRRLWALSYDIACDRRRRAVVACLEGKGDRVQESVFEFFLSYDDIQQLRAALNDILNLAEDKCALFPLCRWCQEKVEVIGRGRRTTRPTCWIV